MCRVLVIARATTYPFHWLNPMKYNININQNVLSSTPLDLIDCAILDWLTAFCNSTNVQINKFRDDNGFTWVSYSILMKDMPLLRIKSKGALSKRINSIKNAGFIDTYVKNGDRLYVKLLPLVDTLVFSTVHENERNRSLKETVPFAIENATVRLNEPTIIHNHNTRTIDNIISKADDDIVIEPVEFQYDPLFLAFWSAYPKKVGKGQAYAAWRKIRPRVSKVTADMITASVQSHIDSQQWKNENGKYIPNPATYLNQRRWEDELSSKSSVMSKYDNLKVHHA